MQPVRARSRPEWGLGLTDRTVLEIFLLFDVPAGGQLALATFRRCWRRYQLQDAELVLSIERLERRGWIAHAGAASAPEVTLTDEGLRNAAMLPMPWKALRRWLLRWQLQ